METSTSDKGRQQKKTHFDKDTGTIDRECINFNAEGDKKRGYGKTKEFDDHPLLTPQLAVIVGTCGSGKTILALNVLDEIMNSVNPAKLGKVMVYSGSPQDSALKHIDRDSVDVYSPETAQSLLDDLRSLSLDMENFSDDATDKPFNVLLLDDAGNSKELSPTVAKGSEIGNVFVSHRHLNLFVIVLAQKFKMLNTFLRSNMSRCFIFPSSKSEEDDVLKDLPLPKESLQKTLRAISSKPHQFLHVDVKRRTATRGFSELVLS